MKRRIIGVLILLMTVVAVNAQQDAEYSLYMFNGLFLNPAYAGSKEVISMNALYRHQWAGVEGAPRSGSFSMHTPFKRTQYAVGLTLTSDRLGITDMYSTVMSYAYRIKAGEDIKISLGVQGGFTYYLSENSKINEADPENFDQVFAVDDQLFLPNFGFGFYVYSKKFYVGGSVPHLLNNSLTDKLNFSASEDVARQYKHYMFTAGMIIGKDEAQIKFKPSFLIKYVQGAPVALDLNASILLKNRFWFGASYRFGGDADSYFLGNSIIGLMEFKATPQLSFGYAYDHSISKIGDFDNGTHEVMVGYEFGFDKARFVTPRYFTYF